MLDIPQKTFELIETLKASLPFEVKLSPQLTRNLAGGDNPINVGPKQMVSQIFYFGDEGGIMCKFEAENSSNPVLVSLTQLGVDSAQPFAREVFAYQKHRIKKLKKQNSN